MRIRRVTRLPLEGPIALVLCCAAAVFAAAPCSGASIPAWLDEAITSWNERNPTQQFRFAGIKDSFVWYRIQRAPGIGPAEIRGAAYKLVQGHGYVTTDDEEMVTTGKPPADAGASTPKKCWRRSFVLSLDSLSNTTAVGGEHSGVRQRMLTSMVCDDNPEWAAGFRVSE